MLECQAQLAWDGKMGRGSGPGKGDKGKQEEQGVPGTRCQVRSAREGCACFERAERTTNLRWDCTPW